MQTTTRPDRLWSDDMVVWATKHEKGWRLFSRNADIQVTFPNNLVSEYTAKRRIRNYERSLVNV